MHPNFLDLTASCTIPIFSSKLVCLYMSLYCKLYLYSRTFLYVLINHCLMLILPLILFFNIETMLKMNHFLVSLLFYLVLYAKKKMKHLLMHKHFNKLFILKCYFIKVMYKHWMKCVISEYWKDILCYIWFFMILYKSLLLLNYFSS